MPAEVIHLALRKSALLSSAQVSIVAAHPDAPPLMVEAASLREGGAIPAGAGAAQAQTGLHLTVALPSEDGKDHGVWRAELAAQIAALATAGFAPTLYWRPAARPHTQPPSRPPYNLRPPCSACLLPPFTVPTYIPCSLPPP